jgi:hypothetical protein
MDSHLTTGRASLVTALYYSFLYGFVAEKELRYNSGLACTGLCKSKQHCRFVAQGLPSPWQKFYSFPLNHAGLLYISALPDQAQICPLRCSSKLTSLFSVKADTGIRIHLPIKDSAVRYDQVKLSLKATKKPCDNYSVQ